MPENSVTPEERELLLKDADWIRADINDARDKLHTVTNAYILAVYGVAAWIIGKALDRPLTIENADAYLWSLRTRPDIALALCAVPVLSCVVTLLQFYVGALHLANSLLLSKIAMRLGSYTAWRSQLRVEGTRLVRLWRSAYVFIGGASSTAAMFGALWFVYPAAQRSHIVHACWWVSLVLGIVAVIAAPTYIYSVKLLAPHDFDDAP
jgi:hypothetical protein